MLPVNPGGHAAYQNFVVTNLRKYYPDPNAFSPATWDIIERFWNLDLSYTDELLRSKYSVFGPKPRTLSCMQRSYLQSIDFNRYLKYYLCEAAMSLVRCDAEYRSFYHRKYHKVNKYQHQRALALTARKLVRLVFRLLKDNCLYRAPESK